MGAILTLFDKSFLQSLSLDEAVLFDHYFFPVICPIFLVETLADLDKRVREGRTPEQEVGIIADKVPEMSGGPCAFHLDLAAHSLGGGDVPMHGYSIPSSGGRPVKVSGKAGFVMSEPREAIAFRRWQNRQFAEVERLFARAWRDAMRQVDLGDMATEVQSFGITSKTCKSLDEVKRLVDGFVDQSGTIVVSQINLGLEMFGVRPEYDLRIFARWASQGRLSFRQFAPYAAHVIAVDLFFRIALGTKLISGAKNDSTDFAYLCYLPFCKIFVSWDNLHRRCAPYFLRKDQSFVWGADLKADLARVNNQLSSLPEAEREQGLIGGDFARMPPDNSESLIVQLWDKHWDGWRKALRSEKRPPKQDPKLLEHINRVSSARSLLADEVDFKPTDAQFLHLTRSVSKKRGSWHQVPKDLKD